MLRACVLHILRVPRRLLLLQQVYLLLVFVELINIPLYLQLNGVELRYYHVDVLADLLSPSFDGWRPLGPVEVSLPGITFFRIGVLIAHHLQFVDQFLLGVVWHVDGVVIASSHILLFVHLSLLEFVRWRLLK